MWSGDETSIEFNCDVAAPLACMYLPLHNLAVLMLLPSVGECCGPAKETSSIDIPQRSTTLGSEEVGPRTSHLGAGDRK